MSKGYVYIMSNPSMPGLVKIGRTTRTPEARAVELHQTGVPTPFKVEDYVFSPDCAELERDVHGDMDGCRVEPGREFFLASVDEAKRYLRENHKAQVRGFVEEFLPGHTTIYEPICIDEGTIAHLAYAMGETQFDVAAAIRFAEPEDIARPMSRWKAKLAELQAAEARKSRLT